MSLELHVVSTFWLGSDTSGTFSLHLFCPAIISTWEISLLENAHTLAQRTDIFSCKFTAKVYLMLDNPFIVPSLCKLSAISAFVSNHQQNCLFPSLWSYPRYFGSVGKFQHNIKISIKTARVSRLSVSCDYARIKLSCKPCCWLLTLNDPLPERSLWFTIRDSRTGLSTWWSLIILQTDLFEDLQRARLV